MHQIPASVPPTTYGSHPGAAGEAPNLHRHARLVPVDEAGAVSPEQSGGPRLTFARPVLEAHQVNTTSVAHEPVVCTSSFVPGTGMPVRRPEAQAHLNFLSIGASGPGDVVLSLRALPGLLPYYQRIGLLSSDTTVVQVEPRLDSGRLGFPYTSPLHCLAHDRVALAHLHDALAGAERARWVATFIDQSDRELLWHLGVRPVQAVPPGTANDKAMFRTFAESFGYRTTPGMELRRADQRASAVSLMLAGAVARLRRGELITDQSWSVGWLKLSHGSGGDFVCHIDLEPEALHLLARVCAEHGDEVSALREVSALEPVIASLGEGLEQARRELADALHQAFEANDYSPLTVDSIWHSGEFAPHAAALVLEQDVRACGELVANCSNFVLLRSDGTWELLGAFERITSGDGSFIGSRPIDLHERFGAKTVKDANVQFEAAVKFAYQIGLRGYLGMEFFVVRNGEKLESVMIETNGRIPLIGSACIMAHKLAAPAWLDVNVTAREEIRSIDDFYRIFGEHAAFQPGDFSKAKVILQASRTLQGGELQLPSPQLKVLIVGESGAAAMGLLNQLRAEGRIV